MTYGLGSENRNLPGFIVLGGTKGAKGGAPNWGSGFLPDIFGGLAILAIRAEGGRDARPP